MAMPVLSILIAVFGFLLLVDSFTTFQSFAGTTQVFFNFFEFIVGLFVLAVGVQMYRMKK